MHCERGYCAPRLFVARLPKYFHDHAVPDFFVPLNFVFVQQTCRFFSETHIRGRWHGKSLKSTKRSSSIDLETHTYSRLHSRRVVVALKTTGANIALGPVVNLRKASGLEYTFIRVGEVVEGKEGGAVMVANVTDALPVEEVVRDDVIRLSAEAFMIENATGTVRFESTTQ